MLTRAPSLTRHSITRAPPLALEAGDTSSEVFEPPKPGAPSDWWRTLRTSVNAGQRPGSGRLSADSNQQPRLPRGSGGNGGGAAEKKH